MTFKIGETPNDDVLANLPFPALVIDEQGQRIWWNRRWDGLSLDAKTDDAKAAMQKVIQIGLHSIKSAPESRKQYTTIPENLRPHLGGAYEGVFIARMDDNGSGSDHFYMSLMDIPRLNDSFWRVWEAMSSIADEERLFSMFYWNIYRNEDGRLYFHSSDYRANGGFELNCAVDEMPDRFEFVNHAEYRQFLLDLAEGRAEGESRIVAHARTPLGRDRYFETIGAPTPKDPRLLASGLAIDVTAMVQARQAQEQSAHLGAVRFAMTGVAHELNNMLTSVYASVEMLGFEFPDDPSSPQRKELDRLTADLKRGQKISQSLMKLAALASTPPAIVSPDYVAMKPNGVSTHSLQRIVDSVAVIARQVEFTHEIQIDGFPVLRDVDEERLSGAVVNLALNALKAISQKAEDAPEGYVGRLQLRIEGHGARPNEWPPDDKDDPCKHGCLQITLEDNGIGMSEEVRQRCTEPFFSTDAEHGNGMGMSETLALAMATKGSLHVKSKEGEGTRVMIFLPAPEPL